MRIIAFLFFLAMAAITTWAYVDIKKREDEMDELRYMHLKSQCFMWMMAFWVGVVVTFLLLITGEPLASDKQPLFSTQY